MPIIASFVFHFLWFHHEGNIVTIDQLDYWMPLAQISNIGNLVPLVGDIPSPYQSVGVGLFKISSHIGVFAQLPLLYIPSSSSKSQYDLF